MNSIIELEQMRYCPHYKVDSTYIHFYDFCKNEEIDYVLM